MLKAAIEKITELAKVETFDFEGQHYATKQLSRIPPHVDRPQAITLNGLDSACKLIRTELPKIGTKVMVQVCSETKVKIMTTYLADFSRNDLYEVRADVPGISTGYRDRERALIELRSLFIPNAGTAYLLDLLARMTTENSVATQDNGVTQTVEAKQGVVLKAVEQIKPRIELQPFRTFLEVGQPASEFLLRINEDGEVGLFEADGGVWKLEAKRNVVAYLEAALKDLVDSGDVVVMM